MAKKEKKPTKKLTKTQKVENFLNDLIEVLRKHKVIAVSSDTCGEGAVFCIEDLQDELKMTYAFYNEDDNVLKYVLQRQNTWKYFFIQP